MRKKNDLFAIVKSQKRKGLVVAAEPVKRKALAVKPVKKGIAVQPYKPDASKIKATVKKTPIATLMKKQFKRSQLFQNRPAKQDLTLSGANELYNTITRSKARSAEEVINDHGYGSSVASAVVRYCGADEKLIDRVIQKIWTLRDTLKGTNIQKQQSIFTTLKQLFA